jgi:hypothetical protein
MIYLLFVAMCSISPEIPDSIPVFQAYAGSEDIFSSCLDYESWRTRYGEPWLLSASPSMPSTACDSFQLDNIFDGDLATAWISSAEDAHASEYICVQSPLAPDPENEQYFYFTDIWGDEDRITKDLFCVFSLNIYNGWQKSPETWREYSRIKRILVWNNDRMYCVIELEDTMYPQIVDILRFHIRNPEHWEFTMPYGGSFKLEISDVYPGDTYQNTGLSELLIGWSSG